MGRIRRQRKYKACDPFSKEQAKKGGNNQQSFDRPPKSIHDEHFMESKNLIKFKEQIEQATYGNQKKKRKILHEEQQLPVTKKRKGEKTHSVKEAIKNSLPKQKNESQKQYFQRLNDNIQEAAMEAMKKDKKIRKKRKDHLKDRDQKRKTKKQAQLEKEKGVDFKNLQDKVSFGEVVQQPPSIQVKPRKAPQNKSTTLHLSSFMQKEDQNVNKKHKLMTIEELEEHNKERQRVIDAYRLLKKQKEMKRDVS